ncbi:MAG: hypothetical protein ACYDA8_00440 [Deferrisomatales bacterium]
MIADRCSRARRPLRVSFVALLAALSPLGGLAHANDRAGLWVGTVTVDAVSQVNQATPDLAFDLALWAVVDGTVSTPEQQEVLIAPRAQGWRFTPTTGSPTPYGAPAADGAWTAIAYDDGTWSQGQARLGFGDGGEQTVLGYNTAVWPRTYYFRRTFQPVGSGFDRLRLHLLRDDGAVVYLNGTEVLRSNLPVGLIRDDTPPVTAVGPAEEGRYLVHELDLAQHPTLLTAGANVVAVEVHQHPSELGDPQEPRTAVTASPSTFALRAMLHSDAGSTTRLLKEVYLMLAAAGTQQVPVLVAADRRIPEFQGTGRRLSTAAYDFPGATAPCTGAVATPGTVICDLVLGPNHPTNPFLHPFHPDHDNWDARYEKRFPDDAGAPEESFEVRRTLTFAFETRYPPGCEGSACRQYPPPGWGESSLGGTFREVLQGLHRDDITVTGSFRLDRLSSVDRLEQ